MSELFPSPPQAPGEFERSLLRKGISPIIGVDEAGRGALCGPVVAGAVVLHSQRTIHGINDSKLLSKGKREVLFDAIKEDAETWGIGEASAEEIDRLNILQATFLAMRRAIGDALKRCPLIPGIVLVDGNQPIPDLEYPQKTLVKGDQRSFCIGAASILAKVHRDRRMLELHAQFPEYGFDRHVGYGTVAHYQALKLHGLTPIHRRTFCRKVINPTT